MMIARAVLVLGLLAAARTAAAEVAATTVTADGEWPPRIEALRVSTPPVVDGRLDDQAWQAPPLPLGDWITYNPLNGEKLAQRTEVWLAYDEKSLYFAFHCIDPEPDKVRATLSRRDQLFNDDWVGLSLDGVGTGQTSYDMFVNPRGVQGDILTTSSAGEQLAPDWVWDSAGQTTADGYTVEIRLPLKSIRFKSGRDVRMGIMFWRRVSRLGMSASWPEVLPGKSFIERHAALLLHDLKPPLTLEMIPSVTYSWNQTRATPDRFGAADSEPDAGLSLKYGVTSSVTLEGTVNPDFSQVESDAFQVEVNQRFPIFYSEKRPFFMEGMGTFELAGAGGDSTMRTAVHTRRIVDPLWGGKLSGTLGRVTFATLSASDEAPGRPIDGEDNPFLGRKQGFYIGRALYSLGKNRYVGGIVTDTELARGHNRVGGGDVSLRLGSHQWSATFLASQTRSPEGETKSGFAGQTFYVYESKRWLVANQLEHYDTDFQMDTAFLNQTGITNDWSFVALSLYPDAKKHPWLKRVVPFTFMRFAKDREQAGNLTFIMGGLRLHTTRQGFFRVDGAFGQEPWQQRVYPLGFVRAFGGAQWTKWLNVFVNSNLGRAIYYDADDPFLGRSRWYSADVSFQPSSSFNQSVSYNRAEFDRLSTGEHVYRVNVLNTKTTYQFDKHFFARAIVQYDSSRRRILTDVLGSFELLPGTVVYAGYGSLIERRAWDGQQFVDERGEYLTTQRGFFFKASYIHRF
jgi:hypothetical protein